jgi:hypothetical protein
MSTTLQTFAPSQSTVSTATIQDNAITPAKLSTGAPTWTAGSLFQFNSGYGSNATAYGCRAWVNFNGTGTVAIRASGNVTSITDNGTGDYTVNFTTAMPDASYSVSGSTVGSSTGSGFVDSRAVALLAGSCRFGTFSVNLTALRDHDYVEINIFR